MKKIINMAVVIFSVLSAGCTSVNESSLSSIPPSEFYLTDPSGARTTTFSVGQDIRFHYSILNPTAESQSYRKPDTGPFVTFEVWQADSLIGTSDDGFEYAAVITEGSLMGGDTLLLDYNWFSVDLHKPLPAGEYTAWAKPRLQFNDIETPAPEKISFKIIFDASQSACDSLNLVLITDQSPNSIQLDPFELKSIEIVRDTITLDITHSGGCKEHSYTLFMSPAAFLESFPAQANLYLRHNGHSDACEALIRTTVSFNLQPIAELYQNFYGRKDEIIINVFDYFENEPGNKLSASYFP
jgi:hypothetical protein